MKQQVNVFWFRADIRLEDNVGLSAACLQGANCLAVFIFSKELLEQLQNSSIQRRSYLYKSLDKLSKELMSKGSRLQVFIDQPIQAFQKLMNHYDVVGVYCNRVYEPMQQKIDGEIQDYLKNNGVDFFSFKDQVIFEAQEIRKNDLSAYSVYSAYAKKWRNTLKAVDLKNFEINKTNFLCLAAQSICPVEELGFEIIEDFTYDPSLDIALICDYDTTRDYPFMQGTTQIGMALSLGTISIRQCVSIALLHNSTWLGQLIWRDFFKQVMVHRPNVVTHCFKSAYEGISWRNNIDEFKAWCDGNTGYALVDAGMRELNQTGQMHNRVRMVVASFLCKHLLIDYRWGEAYFASKLNDYDLALNNGNWQWVAGSGCDSVPYFRVFNPLLQQKRFDPQMKYIKTWIPGVDSPEYPLPIVEHKFARERALQLYKQALYN